MAERYVEVDGRRVRVGSLADAAALCRKRDGRPLTSDDYRWLVRNGGAPGPLLVPNPLEPAGERVASINPVTGVQEYPLDDVAAFQAARPGTGGYRPAMVTPETVQHTANREHVLVAAGDERLAIVNGVKVMDGEQVSRGIAMTWSDVHRMGLLVEPAAGGDGPVRLAEAGIEVLTRWGVITPDT